MHFLKGFKIHFQLHENVVKLYFSANMKKSFNTRIDINCPLQYDYNIPCLELDSLCLAKNISTDEA